MVEPTDDTWVPHRPGAQSPDRAAGRFDRDAVEAGDRTVAADTVGAMAERLIGSLRPHEVLLDRTPPERVGRYVIERELGRGGMGVVYAARDPQLERRVAIKLVSSYHELSDEDRRLFLREARVGTSLHHQGIVRAFDVGEHEGRPFLVMDCVDGTTLREALRDGLPREAAVAALAGVAEALAYAHGRKLVHRDVKPENIILRSDDGRAQLTDFGVVLETEATRKTKTGAVLGTPVYMSPEQGRGDPEPAADVYALGVILYEVLTGKPPFRGGNIRVLLERIAREAPKPPSQLAQDVPPGLEAIALQCLAKDPAQRPSAAHLARFLRKGRLTRNLTGLFTERLAERWESSPRTTTALVVGVLICLLVAALLVWAP
jgi:serine/threonine-protein kinase